MTWGKCYCTRAAVLVLGLMALASCGQPPRGQQDAGLRIALTNSPASFLPVYLAAELGYYKDEGLSVIIDNLSGATKPMQALIGGSADVAD